MLTRHAKVCSSSCLQTVSLSTFMGVLFLDALVRRFPWT